MPDPSQPDPALAAALARLDLGGDLPAPLQDAVAEALAWVYRLDRALARADPGPTRPR